MSARIQIDLVPIGKPGQVGLRLASVASDNEPLSSREIVTTLKDVIASIESGALTSETLPLLSGQ